MPFHAATVSERDDHVLHPVSIEIGKRGAAWRFMTDRDSLVEDHLRPDTTNRKETDDDEEGLHGKTWVEPNERVDEQGSWTS